MQSGKIAAYLEQFVRTLIAHRQAIDFIYEKKLWQGFWRYGWVTRFLIVVALIIGIKFLSILIGWFGEVDASSPSAAMSALGNLTARFYEEAGQFFFAGSAKYIMLILVEVLVFHFCRRTLSLIAERETESSFDDFLKAQIRMIKVAIRSWVLESILSLLIGIALSILGFLDFLKPVLIFGVQCYFLGWAVVDNYNEQFGLEIKESALYTRDYAGIALGVGMVLYVVLMIPLAGPIAGPIVAAVTATLVMYRMSDLHLRPAKEVEEEVDTV